MTRNEHGGLNAYKKSANLAARLTNVSKHDVYVAAQRHSNQFKNVDPGISLIDDAGITWVRANAVVGVSTYPYEVQTFARELEKNRRDRIDMYLSLITPGQSQPINIAFKPLGNVGDPKIFSFSANLFLKVPETKKSDDENNEKSKWRYTRTGIGISGIKLK